MGELVRVQLTRELHLWQRRSGHRVATDDVLCAWSGHTARPEARRALDLGSGHGAVALMMAGVMKGCFFVSIEAQTLSFRLLEQNVLSNQLEDRFRLIHGDLRDETPLDEGFDLITGTPPFMPVGTGTAPQDPQREAARFEIRGGIEAYCDAAVRHLAPGGVVILVMDAARPERYERAFQDARLHLHRVTTVLARDNGSPRYLIYRGSQEPTDTVARQTFAIRDTDGEWTRSYQEIRGTLQLPGT